MPNTVANLVLDEDISGFNDRCQYACITVRHRAVDTDEIIHVLVDLTAYGLVDLVPDSNIELYELSAVRCKTGPLSPVFTAYLPLDLKIFLDPVAVRVPVTWIAVWKEPAEISVGLDV